MDDKFDFCIAHRAVYGENDTWETVYDVYDLNNPDDRGTLYKTYELAEEHVRLAKGGQNG